MAGRIRSGVSRGRRVAVEFEGKSVDAYEGETIAAALLAGGIKTFRKDGSGAGRGPWCGMGVCYDCLVRLEGKGEDRWVRACMTPVADGLRIAVAVEGE